MENPVSLESPLTRSLLADSIQKYPPRENLLRIRSGKPLSPTKTPRLGGGDNSIVSASSVNDSQSSFSPTKGNGRSSPSREVDGLSVSPTRGSLLGPFNFMTSNIETIKADEFTREEMTTVHRQLVLLRLQMKYKNNQDRVLSKDQVLQAWYYVTEQEEKTFLMQRKLEEFESVFSGQRKLEDMERQVEKTYESLAPTFEKLAKFNEIKTAQKNRRAFMKSTKSFRAKATINQEYSQKILDLEKSVRHIERMNEKKVRLHKAPVLQSVHRINSMNSSQQNLLSQKSSFVDELKKQDEPKEPLVTPEKVAVVPPSKPVVVAVESPPVQPVQNKPKQIKHVDNPMRPPEKEEVTLRKVDEAALALAKAAQTTTAAAQSTQEMLQAKGNLRSTATNDAPAVEPSPVASEFQQVQLNRTEKDDAATKKVSSTDEAASRRDALLDMAKNSLRHLEKPDEEVKEASVEPATTTGAAALQVQLRKVEIVAPVVEKDNEQNVLAVTKESLRKVASRDEDVAASSAVEIVLTTPDAADNNDDDDANVGVDASAFLDDAEHDDAAALAVGSASSSAKVETPIAPPPPSYAESTGGSEKVVESSVRSTLGRSNSENSRQSAAAQFLSSQPVSHSSSFYKATAAVRNNNEDNDAASVTSTLSSHTSAPPPASAAHPPRDVSHSSSAVDMSTPQRTSSVDIEHLKDSLRPTPMRDASLRNNNGNNNDEEDVDASNPAVPIMRVKEHLNPVVINQDKTRGEEDSNGWAAPILQAKETLRPISVREKDLHLKDPATFAAAAGSETVVETQTSDAAQSPNVVKEATPPPATEFERKASVFGKLVRKVSGIMNQATAAAMSPAYAERMQQNQNGGSGSSGIDGGGAALFEMAMNADAQQAEEDHSASRQKMRDPSYDPTNKHHDHDDDIDDDLAIVHDDDFLGDLSFSRPVGFAASTGSTSNKNPSTPSRAGYNDNSNSGGTPSRSATKSGSDVQVVSLTKANLERTMSLRAESADSNGPGVSFRGSFSNGHKKLSFADEPATPATTTAAVAGGGTSTTAAMSPAQASRGGASTVVALTPEALERHKANTSPTPQLDGTTSPSQPQPVPQEQQQQQQQQHQLENASQISGSETESVIKKKKSGMNFMKGLRKRTSSIFGSKSGSQYEINTTNLETASNVSASASTPTPVAAAAALSPTQRQFSETGSVSDAGFDDSASQTDANNNKQLRKKSGGFSSFIRSTSSVFRRSKSGNVYGNTGGANDGVIPEDEEMDFSETMSPTGAQSVSQQNVFAAGAIEGENDADETGSQMTANSEQKKKRLSMKGLMKRTSSLFKK